MVFPAWIKPMCIVGAWPFSADGASRASRGIAALRSRYTNNGTVAAVTKKGVVVWYIYRTISPKKMGGGIEAERRLADKRYYR